MCQTSILFIWLVSTKVGLVRRVTATGNAANTNSEDLHIDYKIHCKRKHPLCGALSQRGLKPIKLTYDPRWPDGRSVWRLEMNISATLWTLVARKGL